MLDKILEENSSEGESLFPSEFLGEGEYESDPENVIAGFKIFQKRHVIPNTILQMLLVILALVSQILAVASDPHGDIQMNIALIIICFSLGIWVISRPVTTLKNLRMGIETLKGTIYKAEIYTDRIKISTIYDAPVENGTAADTETIVLSEKRSPDEIIEEGKEALKERLSDEDPENDEDEIPATIIHLDNAGVEITETEKLLVIYIKKINIYVIPKSILSEDEIKNMRDRLTSLMGVRFRAYED